MMNELMRLVNTVTTRKVMAEPLVDFLKTYYGCVDAIVNTTPGCTREEALELVQSVVDDGFEIIKMNNDLKEEHPDWTNEQIANEIWRKRNAE